MNITQTSLPQVVPYSPMLACPKLTQFHCVNLTQYGKALIRANPQAPLTLLCLPKTRKNIVINIDKFCDFTIYATLIPIKMNMEDVKKIAMIKTGKLFVET